MKFIQTQQATVFTGGGGESAFQRRAGGNRMYCSESVIIHFLKMALPENGTS